MSHDNHINKHKFQELDTSSLILIALSVKYQYRKFTWVSESLLQVPFKLGVHGDQKRESERRVQKRF